MEPVLRLDGIDKAFPGVKALDGARLHVYPGQVMGLMGENGAGKSTLMKVLTGIYRADAGTLNYLGDACWFEDPRASQQAGISIIHQELNLIGGLSIAENLFLGREPLRAGARIDWPQLYRQADALLARLGVQRSSREKVAGLSIGEQQMVEIAKALSFESKVIVMDEPTDALSDRETETLFRVIGELKADGVGIVYISHRMQEIFAICDRITVMRDGQFIAEHPAEALDEARLIELMVGRPLSDLYPRVAVTPGAESLAVEGLSGPGVNGVSFALRQGEILGFSGLMGAGRSELMRLLCGDVRAHAGTVRLNGTALTLRHPADAIKAGITYISEDRKGDGLVLGMSVKANMSLAALGHFSQMGRLKHADEQSQTERLSRRFNIKTPSLDQAIGKLSGGNQQKAAIAKGVMARPRVLILDEPTRGVDVGAKKEIYELINQLKQDGMSILIVSSDLPEVMGLSDRILVMHQGQISGEFAAASATQSQLLAAALGKTHNENQA